MRNEHRKLNTYILSLLCAGIMYWADTAHAVLIELNVGQPVRARDEQGRLSFKGQLVASGASSDLGPVIEIPDQFATYDRKQNLNLPATLRKWQAERWNLPKNERPVWVKWKNGTEEVYYPVSIAYTNGQSLLMPTDAEKAPYLMTLKAPSELGKFRVVSPLDVAEHLAPRAAAFPTQDLTSPDGELETECETCRAVSIGSQAPTSALAQIAQAIQKQEQPSAAKPPAPPVERYDHYEDPAKGLPKACGRFIGKSGAYGEWGKMLKRELEQYSVFSEDNRALQHVCPAYNSLNTDVKHDFIIHVLTQLSAIESSCREDIESPPYLNPNGVAVGLFQMEQKNHIRKARDIAAQAEYGRSVCSGSPYEAKHNISCSVYILNQQLTSRGLFERGTYWGPLLRKDKRIVKAIEDYKPCWQSSRK